MRRVGREKRGCRREAQSHPGREQSIANYVQSITEYDMFVLLLVLFGTGLRKESGKR